ncbi:hypothetical protein F5X99DRAFT_427788 [Biscogniauxia marginata]|nr:hypothetical protein F5X99DRAFT_427788 [Biscogniauxia marginata]
MVNLLFWRSPRVAPPTVPTDTVIPLHCFDDRPINKSIIMLFMMRFDDVLDSEKLRGSLEKLLAREGWRKLGARLRLNSKGKLDYHVPASLDRATRPAIAYSHVRYDVSIGEHPLASRLPRAESLSGRPAVVCNPDDFIELMRRPDGPTSLDDYLYGDEPQLGLHVVSFADATLVSLNWPHTLLDGMGRRALFEAWTAVLEGREDEVLPFYGFDHDPLADLGTKQEPDAEPFRMAKYLMSSWQMMLYGVRYLWEIKVWRREEEVRIVFTKSLFEETRAEFLNGDGDGDGDDGSTPDGQENGKPGFLSEGDILSAYVSRLATQPLRASPRTVCVANAYGLRGALPFPRDRAYVANAVWGVSALLRARDVAARPLCATAAAVRRSIAEQGTRAQLEARAAYLRARGGGGGGGGGDGDGMSGMPDLYGDAGMTLVTFSNWTKGRFFETDFSAAIVEQGGSGGGGDGGKKPSNYKRGCPSYIQPSGFVQNLSMRNSFPIIGKDAVGNYWWAGTLRKGLWAGIEETLRAASPAKGV